MHVNLYYIALYTYIKGIYTFYIGTLLLLVRYTLLTVLTATNVQLITNNKANAMLKMKTKLLAYIF